MKKSFTLAFAFLIGTALVRAVGPTPSYQWNFNMTNSSPATNYILPTTSGGVTGFPPTSQGVLRMLNSGGSAVNLLGIPGSGVSGGSEPSSPYDRAITLAGAMGSAGPISVTPDQASTIAVGLITNFTITAWVKPDSAINGFPRIFILGGQGVDGAGGGGNPFNSLGLLFFTGNNLQLKVHNTGANGISTSTGPLASAQTNWAFVAVTYDSTVDPLVTSNVFFYLGDRVNSLGTPIGLPYIGTSINSVAPANPNGPGYINFAGNDFLNGDSTPGITNAWVAIGNRPNDRGRSFNGRYDDVRFYANQVLSQSQLEQVRMDAYPFQPQPLQITTQPQNVTVAEGQGAGLTVEHTEAPNPSYQWYRIDPSGSVSNVIANATNKNYVTPVLTVASDNGAKYAVRVTSTDPIGGTTYSLYGTVTVLPASAYVTTPGMLKFEYYADVPGSSVSDFLGTPPANYPSAPNLTRYVTAFDSRQIFPDDTHHNYFVRITGWITPTETTNYVFYIHGADQARVDLSTDDTTANLAQIAIDGQDGPQVFYGPETQNANPGTYFSSPISLVAGQPYAIAVYLKAGTVENFVQVGWRKDSGAQDLPTNDAELSDRLTPIPAAVLSTPALPNGTVSISQNPASTSVPVHSKVTLHAGVSSTGLGPVVLQWRQNGTNIPGATGTNYTTAYLTTTASYDVVVSIPGATKTSTPATVTVTADNVLPTIISATADDSQHAVKVKFSEPVDPVTALNPANYSIPGLTVSSVVFSPDTNLLANPAYDSVKLTTSGQASSTAYTVTVTGVKDTANNTIAGSNAAGFTSFGFLSGYAKVEYYENQTYSVLQGFDVNGFVTSSMKFTNSDPDTVVYRTIMEMSPDGTPTIRSGGNLNSFPTSYGTKISSYFVAPETTNYVFYIAANDTGLLWLSTDSDPANKHVIAYQDFSGGKRTWNTSATVNNNSASFPTSYVGFVVTVPGATPWPVADGNGYAVISLVAGQRYYLELDHFENNGLASYAAVTYVTAADNASVTPPAFGSVPALTGSVIGWPFPAAGINSFTVSGGNANISWSGGASSIASGAIGYPGLGNITASEYTAPVLKSSTNVTGTYSTLSTTSPVSKPATNITEFFRVAP
jgi:hypothetical protein